MAPGRETDYNKQEEHITPIEKRLYPWTLLVLCRYRLGVYLMVAHLKTRTIVTPMSMGRVLII